MQSRLRWALACGMLIGLVGSLRGDEDVRTKAQVIAAGRAFLMKDTAVWDKGPYETAFAGGPRLLATLALLETGSQANAPEVIESVAWAASKEFDKTYLVGLQLAVLARVDAKGYRPQIDRQIAWLVKSAVVRDDQWGWSYPVKIEKPMPDLSNTQFAVLGLHAAATAGVPIDRKVWLGVRNQLLAVQLPSGGFAYPLAPRQSDERVTMTAAGAYCLAVCQKHLGDSHAAATQALDRALGRLTLQVPANQRSVDLYLGYAIRRACTVANVDVVALGQGGKADWRRELLMDLRAKQRADGSWSGLGLMGNPTVATSLALLCLAN